MYDLYLNLKPNQIIGIMKKFITVAAAVAFVVSMSSCKKEYECCWYTDGVKDENSPCVVQEMSKSDAEDANVVIGNSEFKCVN